jgi:hypothetical protein
MTLVNGFPERERLTMVPSPSALPQNLCVPSSTRKKRCGDVSNLRADMVTDGSQGAQQPELGKPCPDIVEGVATKAIDTLCTTLWDVAKASILCDDSMARDGSAPRGQGLARSGDCGFRNLVHGVWFPDIQADIEKEPTPIAHPPFHRCYPCNPWFAENPLEANS